MHPRTPTLALAAIAGLVTAAVGVLAVEGLDQNESDAVSQDFQALFGGLGLGPRVNLAGCANCFDPRLDDRCWGSGPLETGFTYCPEHGLSVFAYRRVPIEPGPAEPPTPDGDLGAMDDSAPTE